MEVGREPPPGRPCARGGPRGKTSEEALMVDDYILFVLGLTVGVVFLALAVAIVRSDHH